MILDLLVFMDGQSLMGTENADSTADDPAGEKSVDHPELPRFSSEDISFAAQDAVLRQQVCIVRNIRS